MHIYSEKTNANLKKGAFKIFYNQPHFKELDIVILDDLINASETYYPFFHEGLS